MNAVCRVWYCDVSVAEAMRKQRTVMCGGTSCVQYNFSFLVIAHKAAAFPGSTDAWVPAGSVSMQTSRLGRCAPRPGARCVYCFARICDIYQEELDETA